ncbi:CRISPR system precrRNA processing endoribonuclease RAMP protein Cas6 [Paraglaciecola sp. 20A4]|uniref:CRISPR system precrRNA processing endoribonuclease RAMP protein Cas6 n=1 Tax=Paraglaciecola sp. 20A4 TaxID=2687288 RepID=UPI00140AB5BC|nr:CRISPR system precrRNA processing endoribonuclease RAMP protein Cas6 [Paraglaciecola sp. 20A4]
MAHITTLLTTLQQLAYFECIITCQSDNAMPLAPYKGATFHGGFGWALGELDRDIMQMLYDCRDHHGHTIIKPFVLLPPTDTLTHYPRGHEFTFRLKLFGRAAKHVQDVLAAIFLWQNMGLGKSKASFTIRSIDLQLPANTLRVYQQGAAQFNMPAPMPLGHFIEQQLAVYHPLSGIQLTAFITTQTPMELHKNKRQLYDAPDAKTFFWLIAQRLSQLCIAYGDNKQAELHACLPSDELPLTFKDTNVFGQARASTLMQTKHELKGLTGTWAYVLNDELALAWLLAGQLIHVGKKSSFGFGGFNFSVAVGQ